MALVVVHAHDGVEAVVVDGLVEDCVGGMGAGNIHALLPFRDHARRDDLVVFVAEHAVFASVGVEAADGYPWPGDEAPQSVVGKPDHAAHAFRRNAANGLGQGYVGANVGYRNILRGEHHRVLARVAQIRDKFGVADEAWG